MHRSQKAVSLGRGSGVPEGFVGSFEIQGHGFKERSSRQFCFSHSSTELSGTGAVYTESGVDSIRDF